MPSLNSSSVTKLSVEFLENAWNSITVDEHWNPDLPIACTVVDATVTFINRNGTKKVIHITGVAENLKYSLHIGDPISKVESLNHTGDI